MKDVNSDPGRHFIHHAPSSSMWEKKLLFESSDGVGGNKGLTEVDTHLLIATVGTPGANTYSLLYCL